MKTMKERKQYMNKKEQNVNEENQKEEQNVNEQEQILNEEEPNINERQQLNKGDNQDYIQQQDSYDRRAFNLEQNRSNKWDPNQGKVLPFYLPDQENKYKSQTENLVFCRTCGKPLLPKQH